MNGTQKQFFNSWLDAVNTHLSVRRMEVAQSPKPSRNREREKARRQARQLFAEYYADRAIELAS
ncbi:MAG: hypothetical protein ACFB9M_07980 [Myxococcota bacterium]